MNHPERVKEVATIVEPLLGAVLTKHVAVKGMRLVLEVNSEAWGAQINNLKPKLLELFEAALPIPVTDIHVILRRKEPF